MPSASDAVPSELVSIAICTQQDAGILKDGELKRVFHPGLHPVVHTDKASVLFLQAMLALPSLAFSTSPSTLQLNSALRTNEVISGEALWYFPPLLLLLALR